MKVDVPAVRKSLKAFDFKTLFYEHLGWDKHQARLDVPVDNSTVTLTAIAQKRGFVAFVCDSIPARQVRLKIDHQVTKSAREHFVIYADEPAGQQVWHWVRRETGKPLASRDHRFDVSQSGALLIQRLERIAVSMEEEEKLTLPDMTGRGREAFDVDKVTKKFYERFKAEHAAFLKLITGFPPPIKKDGKPEPHPDLQWYTSLMLNRLMFVYFMQKKGFLDGDTDYLRNRLAMVQQQWCRRPACEEGSRDGRTTFFTFYRYFLLRLFHDGLGKSLDDRKLEPAMEKLLGKIPFLNGGFFEVHKLEKDYPDIDIPDEAFEKLFDFFEYADKANGVRWDWHLDERTCRADNEINPDVVGYIFEKYINQKQMGAYYTKEDITEYISKNTIIPYLFDAAKKKCAIAFKPDSALWRLLQDDPDRYIYPAVGHGITCDYDRVNHRDHKRLSEPLPLPPEIEAGVNDVTKRDGWNKTADPEYGLPTETWREVVARRQRCLDIREKLKSGAGVSPASSDQAAGTAAPPISINDLITLNLDIWQFARDAIVNAEGPELLRAFWRTLAGRMPEKSNEQAEPGITILDPTCGSGAFLFAALRILETLYSDCLERMERFVEEADAQSGECGAGVPPASSRKAGQRPAPHSAKYSDFRHILGQIGEHRGESYFILKSIIINNLFGVDIMEEAVEICKLRLFLKLVAQVEPDNSHPHYGLEPLPDIDFNIRAGNTLVGFASLDQVKKSMEGDMLKLLELPRIEEEAGIVDQAFKMFQRNQVEAKADYNLKKYLQERLSKLNLELDRYLASEYGVDCGASGKSGAGVPPAISKEAAGTAAPLKPTPFEAWKASHQPFHWLVEFYGIMAQGGFDVIIGNPPYVEYSQVKRQYRLKGYKTEPSGNLYAFVIERCFNSMKDRARCGMIVQLPMVCTDRMITLQTETLSQNNPVWFATFDDRPARLFDGLEHIRATIFITSKYTEDNAEVYSTQYNRWYSESRNALFPKLSFIESNLIFHGAIPKIGDELAKHLLELISNKDSLSRDLSGSSAVYFHNAPQYWVRAMDSAPYFWNERDGEQLSTQVKTLRLPSKLDAAVTVASLNSSLFYWWFLILSDCRHLNMREIENFPLGLGKMPDALKSTLAALTDKLMADFNRHKNRKECQYKTTGKVVYDEYFPKHSKPIIDEIDRVLAPHYGFTDEELDFIINYDIKYRMGGAEEEE